MIHLEPLTSLGSFLSTLEAIHTQPNPWVILRCWLLLFFYASLAVHFLSLVFLPLSAIDRILVYDILYLLIPQRAVNLFACAAIHLGAYAYKQLHFNGQLFPHFNLLECLLNGSACRFFLCKRKASCRLIRQLYWQFGATFRCLRIAVVIICLFWHLKLAVEMWTFARIIKNIPLAFAVHLFYGLTLTRIAFSIFTAAQRVLSIGTTLLYACKLRLKQIFVNLQHKTEKVPGNLSFKGFTSYRNHLIQTLLTFDAFNCVYGKLILAFLLVNIPLSLWCFGLLLLGRLSAISTVYVISFLLLDLSIIFGFHLYLVQYSLHLHKPVKLLFRHGRSGFRLALAVSQHVNAFYTNNRYGIRYGGFASLVTVNTFAKFLLLYGKFLLITLKMLKSQ